MTVSRFGINLGGVCAETLSPNIGFKMLLTGAVEKEVWDLERWWGRRKTCRAADLRRVGQEGM